MADLENLINITFRFANHYRNAAFNNPRFLCCYFSQGIAKQVLMIVTDVGDNTHIRRDDIGAA